MLTVERQNSLVLPSKKQLRVYFDYHVLLTLSLINLICKIIVLAGLIITIFSNHWAKSPYASNTYAGYKARCSVHVCLSNNPDPTWLVDLICILVVINLFMELMSVSIIAYFRKKIEIIDMILGLMFVISLIITDCGIVFAIHTASFVHQSPMGYAYYYFIMCIIFSMIDWGLSLKRFISNWPEIICLTDEEHTQILKVHSNHYSPVLPKKTRTKTSSNSYSYSDATV